MATRKEKLEDRLKKLEEEKKAAIAQVKAQIQFEESRIKKAERIARNHRLIQLGALLEVSDKKEAKDLLTDFLRRIEKEKQEKEKKKKEKSAVTGKPDLSLNP